MTDPISAVLPKLWSAATGGSTQTDSAASASGASASGSGEVNVGGLNSNTFLQLLVSQLTHQDPMKPTDATTYITEEAEFSMVQSMNTLAQQNSAILKSQQMIEATSFIGKSVTYTDADGHTASGVVSSASPGSNGAVVRVGGTQVPLSSISQVYDAGAAASGTQASTTQTPTA